MSFSTKSQVELKELFAQGASIEMSVTPKSIEDLCELALHAKEGGGQLILKGASTLDQRNLESITAFGSGHILFKD